jgi:alpha-aminoadipate/glutamate carrier protein LysW
MKSGETASYRTCKGGCESDNSNNTGNNLGGISMVTCPACEGAIDVDEEDVDEGDTISCDECGAALKVVGTDPLELESAEDLEDEDEDEEGFLEEEEEEADEDWK